MPRIRTIKPEFFKHDGLAELPAIARLLFQGLWCLADRDGRLEDRPKRIKAEILPYDECDVDAMLDAIARAGFITRYEVAGVRYIAVPNFKKHQRITGKESETPSTIPAPPVFESSESSEKQRGNNGETTGITGKEGKGKEGKDHVPPYSPASEGSGAGAPVRVSEVSPDEVPFSEPLEGPDDSDLPEVDRTPPPDSAPPTAPPPAAGTKKPQAAPKPKRHEYTAAFEAFWKAYPGGGSKVEAFKEWKAAGLERDEALRAIAFQALQAQIDHRAKFAAIGEFHPQWKDAERWIKHACWEEKLRPLPERPHGLRVITAPPATPEETDPAKKYAW